jgi:hypothetical protein
MITSKINVREHISQYAIGKFGTDFSNPISVTPNTDLYVAIWDLLSPRPADKPIDHGNLEIVIPNRRSEGEQGKKPERFNYLSEKAARILDFKLETMMLAELHDFLDENKHRKGIEYQASVHIFVNKYQIKSITEDALIKNYYRWRKKINRLSTRRSYVRQNV